jgi:hypothetical protein
MGRIANHYGASFDGVSFWEQSSGSFHPGMDVNSSGTLYNHTGGTHTYVDMGKAAGLFEINAAVEAAQRTALEAKRGVSGSLIWSRGTQTATLLDILPSEVDGFDGHKLTLRFFSDGFPSAVLAATAFITESSDTFITESGETLIQE